MEEELEQIRAKARELRAGARRPLDKSRFYRARAEEFRALADNASQARDTFLGLAKTYERVAEIAAEREARAAIADSVPAEVNSRTLPGKRGNGGMDSVDKRSPLGQVDLSCPRCRRHMRPTLEQLAVEGHVLCPCCGLEVGLDGSRYRSLMVRMKLAPRGADPRVNATDRNRRPLR
jgi:hypothetical protein